MKKIVYMNVILAVEVPESVDCAELLFDSPPKFRLATDNPIKHKLKSYGTVKVTESCEYTLADVER
jgi:hypothetical protein